MHLHQCYTVSRLCYWDCEQQLAAMTPSACRTCNIFNITSLQEVIQTNNFIIQENVLWIIIVPSRYSDMVQSECFELYTLVELFGISVLRWRVYPQRYESCSDYLYCIGELCSNGVLTYSFGAWTEKKLRTPFNRYTPCHTPQLKSKSNCYRKTLWKKTDNMPQSQMLRLGVTGAVRCENRQIRTVPVWSL